MSERSKWPIVVGGCLRSGTSLVRRLLDSHTRIHCGPESDSSATSTANTVTTPSRICVSARRFGLSSPRTTRWRCSVAHTSSYTSTRPGAPARLAGPTRCRTTSSMLIAGTRCSRATARSSMSDETRSTPWPRCRGASHSHCPTSSRGRRRLSEGHRGRPRARGSMPGPVSKARVRGAMQVSRRDYRAPYGVAG